MKLLVILFLIKLVHARKNSFECRYNGLFQKKIVPPHIENIHTNLISIIFVHHHDTTHRIGKFFSADDLFKAPNNTIPNYYIFFNSEILDL